jgi:hypothetical protein
LDQPRHSFEPVGRGVQYRPTGWRAQTELESKGARLGSDSISVQGAIGCRAVLHGGDRVSRGRTSGV